MTEKPIRPIDRLPIRALALACVVSTLGMSIGCQTEEKTLGQSDREAIMRDPMNYGPNANTMRGLSDRPEDDFPTVTGGGTSHLDKEALKRDLKNVLGAD